MKLLSKNQLLKIKDMIFAIVLCAYCLGCSSSKKSSKTEQLPSEQKQISKLSKEYPGLFSAQESYIDLPQEEKERDKIVSGCQGARSPEIIKSLFDEMKDSSKVQINYFYIALCYFYNTDYSRANHYFTKVYGVSSDLSLKSRALTNMGIIQWKWGKVRKSLAYLRESYKTKQSPATLYLLTSLELELGLLQKVSERRSEMSKYNYSDVQWRMLQAQTAFFTSDYEQAVIKLETISDADWDNHLDAGSIYLASLYKTGRHQAGKNFYKKWKNKMISTSSFIKCRNQFPEIGMYE